MSIEFLQATNFSSAKMSTKVPAKMSIHTFSNSANMSCAQQNIHTIILFQSLHSAGRYVTQLRNIILFQS